ncbi:MAG: DMT family transporter [Candidatus Heimdallarchaeota archaeon]|nr:DMT family transporter [Candidatus Heimdallarchaeota archaeon]
MVIQTNPDVIKDSEISVNEEYTYGLLLLFSVLAGATWPAGKIIAASLSPFAAAFYRYSIALPIFLILMKTTGSWVSVNKRVHLKLAVLGFLGVTLYNFLFLEGVKNTAASDASLIFAATPTFTILLSNYINPDDKISKKKIVGVVTSLIGVSFIFLQSPNVEVTNRLLGNSLILLSTIVMASYTAFSKPLFKEVSPTQFSTLTIFYGWLFLGILVLFEDVTYLSPQSFLKLTNEVRYSIIYLGLFIAYATIVYAHGIKKIGPSRSAIFINLIPIFGVLSSIILLSEKFSLWYIPSFSLIMVGVYFINRK